MNKLVFLLGSKVGGLLGLCIGISIITVIELIWLCLRLGAQKLKLTRLIIWFYSYKMCSFLYVSKLYFSNNELLQLMTSNYYSVLWNHSEIAISLLKFFYVGSPSGVHLFDHLLWSTFQSSITHYIKTLSSSSYMFHIGIIYSYSNSNKSVTYFHQKVLTLAGIWTGTSPGPSQYATNWAILAWITT